MERILTYSHDACFICNDFLESYKNKLTLLTKYCEKTIYELLEEFTNIKFSKDVLKEAGICQDCLIRFQEYDAHLSIANQIQLSIVERFETSNQNEPMKQEEEELFTPILEPTEEVFEEVPRESIEEIFVSTHEEDGVEYSWFETAASSPPAEQSIKTEKDEMSGRGEHFKCEICSRSFKEKSKLKSHREIHTTERNVICPTCNKAFKTQACLRSHKRIHFPTFFHCDYCGKSYTQKQEISKHIKFVHLNIREFPCESCNASFGTKGHLSAHMLTHGNRTDKSAVCSMCAMAFHTKAKLERHLKSHTGERNYECELCGKTFLYSYNVTAHIRHVHNREKRKGSVKTCSFCFLKFAKSSILNDHLRVVHKVIEESIQEEAIDWKQ